MVAERVRMAVAALRTPTQSSAFFSVTISVGVSMVSPSTRDYHQLLSEADTALYQAKHSGKNRYCIYSEKIGPRNAR